ncbi:hypothetical protein SANTM175S_04644 [Streptomyces antimycoticus]
MALLAELGHVGRRVREDVTARMPGADSEERELLRIGAGEPVLCLERVVLDGADRAIQADMITMPAKRQRLRYELRMVGMTVPKAEQDAVDQRSLHERIAADLRDEIMSGDLPPAAKLPSTAQLKERFTASNATVQKALQLLKDEGLAVGRAGAAVTVREHRQRTMRPASYMAPAAPGEPYRWISEAAAGHRARGTSRLLDVTEIRPPADVHRGRTCGRHRAAAGAGAAPGR